MLGGVVGTSLAEAPAMWPVTELAALQESAPGLAIAGRDAAVSLREDAQGCLLAGCLKGPVGTNLERFLGGEGPKTVLIEGQPDLPWELLTDQAGRSLEGSGQAVIARLAPGLVLDTWEPDGDLRVGLWAADEDAISRTHAQSLRSMGAVDGPGALLHVVCHGTRAQDALLELAQVAMAPGSLAHQLQPWVKGAGMVALDVCASGSGEGDLVAVMLAAGGEACAAPRKPVSVAALDAFNGGLHRALADSECVAGAVAAGRRAVRSLASPRPDARWHGVSLFVTHPHMLSRRLRDSSWRPPGWGRPMPQAQAVLARAYQSADRGYVGIEHLVGALSPLELPMTLRVVPLPSPPVLALRDETRVNTPRLRGFELHDGFDIDDLMRLLLPAIQAWSMCRSLDALERGGSTLRHASESQQAEESPLATLLEVLGGPEDGLVLTPSPGQTIGRWADSGADLMLYATTPSWDPYLSRQHIRWEGPGHVRALRPCRHVRGSKPSPDPHVRVGDLLWLTPATLLWAR